jgi:two-component system, NarL family, invasion response regulator UvrY
MNMITVLIADDNPMQRKLLTLSLSDDENIVVKYEAESGEEVLRNVEENNFDVIILDVSLPKKSGIEVLKELKAMGKKIPVIIVSNYPKEDFEPSALAIGAFAYLEKNDVPDKIIETVRACVPEK